MPNIDIRIKVFLDSGLQKTFIPLCKPTNFTTLPKNINIPASLQTALENIDENDTVMEESTKNYLNEVFNDNKKRTWKDCNSYLKYRIGQKTWH